MGGDAFSSENGFSTHSSIFFIRGRHGNNLGEMAKISWRSVFNRSNPGISLSDYPEFHFYVVRAPGGLLPVTIGGF